MSRMRFVFCTLALAFALGCGLAPVKVADIKRDPGRFENKTVTIVGTAQRGTRLPFITHGFYEVEDSTGAMPVLTTGALPPDGKNVVVRGKVRTAFRLNGQSFGVVVMEGE